jgi:hypothetical protein
MPTEVTEVLCAETLAAVKQVAQGGASEVLQDQQRRLRRVGFDVFVGPDQVRMSQGEQQARLALQVTAGSRVGGAVGPKRLDETTAVALRAPCLVAVQILPTAHVLDHLIARREQVARGMRRRAVVVLRPVAAGADREIGRCGHISSGCSRSFSLARVSRCWCSRYSFA